MDKCQVLIVDDDPDLRNMVATFLRNARYVVQVAADVTSALHIVAASRPTLILLDAHLPDALEHLSATLESQEGEIAIIAMTGAREGDLEAAGIHPSAYLDKPFTLRALGSMVRRYCLPR